MQNAAFPRGFRITSLLNFSSTCIATGGPGTAFPDTTTDLIKWMISCTFKGAHLPTGPNRTGSCRCLLLDRQVVRDATRTRLGIHCKHVEVQRNPPLWAHQTRGSSDAEELAFIFRRVQGPQVISISSVEAVTLWRQLHCWDLRPGIMHIPL